MRRRIETAVEAQVSSLGADVGNLEQDAGGQFLLDTGVPLLHIRRTCVSVQAE